LQPDSRHKSDRALGKWLSWLLRHGAVNEGLSIDTDGFVDVTDIEQHGGFCGKFTVSDIQRIVSENDKQRFTLRTNPISGKFQIKANQGHSINVSNTIFYYSLWECVPTYYGRFLVYCTVQYCEYFILFYIYLSCRMS
jgi:RNA:NAD 2'-phosphotransferase (TPT1/KptA family)